MRERKRKMRSILYGKKKKASGTLPRDVGSGMCVTDKISAPQPIPPTIQRLPPQPTPHGYLQRNLSPHIYTKAGPPPHFSTETGPPIISDFLCKTPAAPAFAKNVNSTDCPNLNYIDAGQWATTHPEKLRIPQEHVDTIHK